jgi:hypothetical protein
MLATLVWLILTAAAWPQAAAPRGVAISGVVQDQTGAVLPGAQVALAVSGAPAASQTVVSDPPASFASSGSRPAPTTSGLPSPASQPELALLRAGHLGAAGRRLQFSARLRY